MHVLTTTYQSYICLWVLCEWACESVHERARERVPWAASSSTLLSRHRSGYRLDLHAGLQHTQDAMGLWEQSESPKSLRASVHYAGKPIFLDSSLWNIHLEVIKAGEMLVRPIGELWGVLKGWQPALHKQQMYTNWYNMDKDEAWLCMNVFRQRDFVIFVF